MAILKYDHRVIDKAVKKQNRPEIVRQPKNSRLKDVCKVLPEYILGMYRTDRYFLETGFSDDGKSGIDNTIEKDVGIGFDKKEKRITFPIRDYLGRLVGVSGRSDIYWHKPRYKVYQFSEIPDYVPENRNHLYLFDRVFPKHFFEVNTSPTIIVEGYKGALWLQQNGYDAVAIQGSQITRSQTKFLSKIGGQKIIFLDNEPGKHIPYKDKCEATKMLLSLIKSGNKVKIAKYPDGCEMLSPDDLNPNQIQWAIKNSSQNIIPLKWKRK